MIGSLHRQGMMMSSKRVQSFMDPVAQGELPRLGEAMGTLASTGISKSGSLPRYTHEEAAPYSPAYLSYCLGGQQGSDLPSPWSPSRTCLKNGRSPVIHPSVSEGSVTNPVIYRPETVVFPVDGGSPTAAQELAAKHKFAYYTRSPGKRSPASAGIITPVAVRKHPVGGVSISPPSDPVSLAIPKPVYGHGPCCAELGCTVGPSYGMDRGPQRLHPAAYEEEWVVPYGRLSLLQRKEQQEALLQRKDQEALLQQRVLQLEHRAERLKDVAMVGYHGVGPSGPRGVSTFTEPKHSSYPYSQTSSFMGSTSDQCHHFQIPAKVYRGGLHPSHPHTYEPVTLAHHGIPQKVYQDLSPVSKYVQIPQRSVFFYPRGNVEVESRALYREDNPSPNSMVPYREDNPPPNSRVPYREDNPPPNSRVPYREDNPPPNSRVPYREDNTPPNSRVPYREDNPPPNSRVPYREDNTPPNIRVSYREDNPPPNSRVPYREDNPPPNSRVPYREDNLPPNSRVPYREDNPPPNSRVPYREDNSPPNSRVPYREDNPPPNSRVPYREDNPPPNSRVPYREDNPPPNSRVPYREDNPPPNSRVPYREDNPPPNSRVPYREDNPAPNVNKQGPQNPSAQCAGPQPSYSDMPNPDPYAMVPPSHSYLRNYDASFHMYRVHFNASQMKAPPERPCGPPPVQHVDRPLDFSLHRPQVACPPREPHGQLGIPETFLPTQAQFDHACLHHVAAVKCPPRHNSGVTGSTVGSSKECAAPPRVVDVLASTERRSCASLKVTVSGELTSRPQREDSDDVYEVEISNKRQKREIEHERTVVHQSPPSPPMPIINNVFSLAPYKAYLEAAGMLPPQRASQSTKQHTNPTTLKHDPEIHKKDPKPHVHQNELSLKSAVHKPSCNSKVSSVAVQEIVKIKKEKMEPQDTSCPLRTGENHCEVTRHCSNDTRVKQEVAATVTGVSNGILNHVVKKSDVEPERKPLPLAPAKAETTSQCKVEPTGDPKRELTLTPNSGSECFAFIATPPLNPMTPTQPPETKFYLQKIPPHCLKLSSFKIVLPDVLRAPAPRPPAPRPPAPHPPEVTQPPAAEPQPSADSVRLARHQFMELHQSLCRLVSTIVSQTPHHKLRAWLSRLDLAEPVPPPAKAPKVSRLLGTEARGAWLDGGDAPAALQKVVDQLEHYVAMRECPFPHVVRAGALFVPMLVVKEVLFPQVRGAFIDQVLQEHRVELRPTTLSEERHLTQLQRRVCSSKLRRLLSLRQLPHIYPDVLSLFYHACVCKLLGVECDAAVKMECVECSDETDSLMSTAHSLGTSPGPATPTSTAHSLGTSPGRDTPTSTAHSLGTSPGPATPTSTAHSLGTSPGRDTPTSTAHSLGTSPGPATPTSTAHSLGTSPGRDTPTSTAHSLGTSPGPDTPTSTAHSLGTSPGPDTPTSTAHSLGTSPGPATPDTTESLKDQDHTSHRDKHKSKGRKKDASKRIFLGENNVSQGKEFAKGCENWRVVNSFGEERLERFPDAGGEDRGDVEVKVEQDIQEVQVEPDYSWGAPVTSDDPSSLGNSDTETESASTLSYQSQSSSLPKTQGVPRSHSGMILKLRKVFFSNGHRGQAAHYQAVSDLSEAPGGGRGEDRDRGADRCHRDEMSARRHEASRRRHRSAGGFPSPAPRRLRRSLARLKRCPYLSACHGAQQRRRWVLRSAAQAAHRATKSGYPELVGKRIRHLYEENDKTEVWYHGVVLRVHESHPNPLNTVFEVKYDGEPEWQYYLELLMDYKKGWLKVED